MSAKQMLEEFGIPIATAYRKLKYLEKIEAIKHSSSSIIQGNEEKYYTSLVEAIDISIKGGKFHIKAYMKEDDGLRKMTLKNIYIHTKKIKKTKT